MVIVFVVVINLLDLIDEDVVHSISVDEIRRAFKGNEKRESHRTLIHPH